MGQWIRTGLLFCGYYQVTKAACCSLDVIRLLKQPAKQPPAARDYPHAEEVLDKAFLLTYLRIGYVR